ncbi:L-lactate dehydrogenase [Bifidobacterium sp.]|jgi:L-lactate dehydrogenase|uniref:L-lactate dehydrogenase n=1 Tax=Bifidobacterium sp. TaxID=41200 RepID=UPI0025C440FC|nr:L-lactate dehydrogenase [Bifidobacterium sp.]MCI1635505.1 L-lactate dehydrogenase [Bifidobacterium sp.]
MSEPAPFEPAWSEPAPSYSPLSVGIIGLGHVGPHVANSLILQGIADELLLCDTNEDKLAAEVQDLNDSTVFAPHRVVVHNCHAEYERLAGCDVIVNSSGQVTLSAISRTGELFKAIDDVRSYVGRIAAAGFTGFWVNVSNPCDVVTREIQRLSGLPASHVMGTGTVLDSARLRTVISLRTGLAPESIQAYMIGEHGNTQIAAWSSISIAGTLLSSLSKHETYNLDAAEVESKAREGGYVSYHGKKCTEYAIGNAATRIVRAIVHNEHVVLSASVQLNGEYGQQGLYISVPCVISAQGAGDIFELSLTDVERKGFEASCDVVRSNYAKLAPMSVEAARTLPIDIPRHQGDDRFE